MVQNEASAKCRLQVRILLVGAKAGTCAIKAAKTQVEFESREALLAERRESEEHCKLLLIAQREKNKREGENR